MVRSFFCLPMLHSTQFWCRLLAMKTLNDYLHYYREQLALGDIQQAYRGLMKFIIALKTHLKNHFPAYFVSGSVYQGWMDFTHFVFTPVAP